MSFFYCFLFLFEHWLGWSSEVRSWRDDRVEASFLSTCRHAQRSNGSWIWWHWSMCIAACFHLLVTQVRNCNANISEGQSKIIGTVLFSFFLMIITHIVLSVAMYSGNKKDWDIDIIMTNDTHEAFAEVRVAINETEMFLRNEHRRDIREKFVTRWENLQDKRSIKSRRRRLVATNLVDMIQTGDYLD